MMTLKIARMTVLSVSAIGLLAAQSPNSGGQIANESDPQSNPQPAIRQSATQQPAVPMHKQANPEQQLKHLTRQLALTGDQQQQILPILTDRNQQVGNINSDTTLSAKERHAKLLAVRSDSQSRLRMVLTDQQRVAYDQMQEDERARAKARRLTTATN